MADATTWFTVNGTTDAILYDGTSHGKSSFVRVRVTFDDFYSDTHVHVYPIRSRKLLRPWLDRNDGLVADDLSDESRAAFKTVLEDGIGVVLACYDDPHYEVPYHFYLHPMLDSMPGFPGCPMPACDVGASGFERAFRSLATGPFIHASVVRLRRTHEACRVLSAEGLPDDMVRAVLGYAFSSGPRVSRWK